MAALALVSCNSNDIQTNPQPDVQPRNGWVSFRIDNVVWQAPAHFTSMGIITATRGQELLQIQLPSDSPGNYNISSSTNPSIRLTGFGGQNYDSYVCSPSGGNISISDNNGALTGTFTARICSNGQIKDMVNGVFTRIPYQ